MKIIRLNLKNMQKQILTFIGVGVFIFILYKLVYSWNQIKNQVYISNYMNLILSIFFITFFFILLAVGWSLIFKNLSERLSIKELIMLYSKSQLVRYIPGGIWNYVGRVALLKKQGESYSLILESFILEAVMLVLSGLIVGLLFYFNILSNLELLIFISVIIFLFIILYNLSRFGILFCKLFKKIQINIVEIPNKAKIKLMGFYIILWIVGSVGFSLFTYSTSNLNSLNFWNIGGVFPISWSFGFISFMPGGIGAREFGLIFLMKKIGMTEISYFISAFSRLLLIVTEILSFFLILIWKKYRNKIV